MVYLERSREPLSATKGENLSAPQRNNLFSLGSAGVCFPGSSLFTIASSAQCLHWWLLQFLTRLLFIWRHCIRKTQLCHGSRSQNWPKNSHTGPYCQEPLESFYAYDSDSLFQQFCEVNIVNPTWSMRKLRCTKIKQSPRVTQVGSRDCFQLSDSQKGEPTRRGSIKTRMAVPSFATMSPRLCPPGSPCHQTASRRSIL